MQLAQLMSPAFQQTGQNNAQIEMQRKSFLEQALDQGNAITNSAANMTRAVRGGP
jgi:hypothetical protein